MIVIGEKYKIIEQILKDVWIILKYKNELNNLLKSLRIK